MSFTKKPIYLILCLILAVVLAGCSGLNAVQTATVAPTVEEPTAVPAEPTAEAAAPAADTTAETAEQPVEEAEATAAEVTEETAEQPAEEAEAPAAEMTEENAEQPAEEAEASAVEATEETVEQPAEEAEAPATETTEETAEQPAEEAEAPAAEVTEETAEQPAEEAEAPAAEATEETAEQTAEEAEESVTAAATVDGDAVSLEDFTQAATFNRYQYLNMYNQYAQMYSMYGLPLDSLDEQMVGILGEAGKERLGSEVIDQLTYDKVLEKEAKEAGLEISEDEVYTQLKTMFGYEDPKPEEEGLAGMDSFNVTLNATDSEDDKNNNFRRYAQTILDSAYGSAVSFDYLKTYAKNILIDNKLFAQELENRVFEAEMVSARHILVEDEETARDILAKLDAGEDWAALASEHSLDTSNKDNSGDLGWFGRGEMVAEFEEAAFGLEPGEISEPVKTNFGYHIIASDGKEVRPLSGSALQNAQNAAYDEWTMSLRAKHDIQSNPDVWMDAVPMTPAFTPTANPTTVEEPVMAEPVDEEPAEAEAAAEEPAEAEAAAEEPAEAETPAEEPAEAEAAAEETAETEVSAEDPVKAEAPAEEPVEVEAVAEEPAEAETPAEETAKTDAPAEEPAEAEAATEEIAETEAPAEEPLEAEAAAEETAETEVPAEEPVEAEAAAEETVETEAPAEEPAEAEEPTEETAETEAPAEEPVEAEAAAEETAEEPVKAEAATEESVETEAPAEEPAVIDAVAVAEADTEDTEAEVPEQAEESTQEDVIVAMVDGKTPIYADDFVNMATYNRYQILATYNQYAQYYAMFGLPLDDVNAYYEDYLGESGKQELGEATVDMLTYLKMLEEEADAQGIHISDKEVTTQMKKVFGYEEDTAEAEESLGLDSFNLMADAGFDSEEDDMEFRAYMDMNLDMAFDGRITYEFFRDSIRHSMMENAVVDKLLEGRVFEGEMVNARHILVEEEETAKDILAKLDAGEEWDALAAEYSLDTGNKDNGGALGWFGRDVMVDEFEDAAFALEPGQISEPVQTSFGWHIIASDGKEMRPLEDEALESAQSAVYQEWYDGLKAKHQVESYPEIWLPLVPTEPVFEPVVIDTDAENSDIPTFHIISDDEENSEEEEEKDEDEDELLSIINTEQEEALTISNTEQENVAYTINNDAEMDRGETAVSETEVQAESEPTQVPEQEKSDFSLSNTAENK